MFTTYYLTPRKEVLILSLRRLRLNNKGYFPGSKQLVNLESNVDLSKSKDVTVIYVVIASFSISTRRAEFMSSEKYQNYTL